jgi:antitoxin VapB
MVLRIRDPKAYRLARELAARTGQPIIRVVVEALREKLKREQGRTTFPRLKDEIMAISRRTAALPRRTGRAASVQRRGFSAHRRRASSPALTTEGQAKQFPERASPDAAPRCDPLR